MTRYLDPVPLWTVAATATSRVRLNASTLSTFYYEPVHLARLLTTLECSATAASTSAWESGG